jgi:hypothetical protein
MPAAYGTSSFLLPPDDRSLILRRGGVKERGASCGEAVRTSDRRNALLRANRSASPSASSAGLRTSARSCSSPSTILQRRKCPSAQEVRPRATPKRHEAIRAVRFCAVSQNGGSATRSRLNLARPPCFSSRLSLIGLREDDAVVSYHPDPRPPLRVRLRLALRDGRGRQPQIASHGLTLEFAPELDSARRIDAPEAAGGGHAP